MVEDENGRRPPAGPGDTAFLRAFDALRARPGASEVRQSARMAKRAARRRSLGNRGGLQRGDTDDPPPVLDLVLEDPGDRRALLSVLEARCGDQPCWRLSSESRRPPGEEAWATTDELYGLMSELVAGADAAAPRGGRRRGWRRPPPWPSFSRLRSLLWLYLCDLGRIKTAVSGEEVTPEGDDLEGSLKAQVYLVAELSRVKLAPAGRDTAGTGRRPQRIRTGVKGLYERNFQRVAGLVARMSGRITFGKADERVLTPGGFVVNCLTYGAPIILGTVVAGYSILALQTINNLVTIGTGLLLVAFYVVLGLFLVLPWRSYRWLGHHRYVVGPGEAGGGRGGELRNHRVRGVHVLNQLKREGGRLTGRFASRPGPDPAPAADGGRFAWMLHQLSGARAGNRGTGTGEGSRDEPRTDPPPGVHRLAVNAFLDDLAQTHGARSPRRLPRSRRGRRHRPVLVVDQENLDRRGRYLVRLIEDERLRRAFPDPLLIVQVRAAGSEPLLGGTDVLRYPVLPEAENGRRPEEPVSLWLRHRYTAGVLGRERLLTLPVPARAPVPGGDGRDRSWRSNPEPPAPVTVWSGGALAAMATGALAALTASAVLVVGVAGPVVTAQFNPCTGGGLWTPRGIERHGQDCVGLTFGDFVFHDRLEEVTDRIHDQNEAIGDKENHVTVVYVASLSLTSGDAGALDLAGVQGELLGLAYQQHVHNSSSSRTLPRLKILLANTGDDWAHAAEVAEQIVERSRNERLGMDRPVAAVGFGHSVQPNSEAIRVLSAAQIPMIGTTATFDGVAREASGKYSQYFFPLAPSNSRLAEQAAAWAYEGVAWEGDTDAEGAPAELGPARTAVAVANSNEGESYGPHLAVEFMSAFRALGGRAWEGEGEPPPIALADEPAAPAPGVVPYQEGGTSQSEILREVCAEDPPDLIYFAGRSVDFGEFHAQIQKEGRCVDSGVDVLAGDDVAKFVTDHAETIGHAAGYPVFYTPLAASGTWGLNTDSSERAFYPEIAELARELEDAKDDGDGKDDEDGENGGETAQGTDAAMVEADGGRPSIAHAALASDALAVLSRALKDIAHPAPAGAAPSDPPSPFLGTDTGYEEERHALVERIQNTSGLSAVSGHIGFGEPSEGNWYPERMVQLVVVGPLGEDGQRQHVVAACGRITPDTVDPGPGCG